METKREQVIIKKKIFWMLYKYGVEERCREKAGLKEEQMKKY
jgi:hypothetical protein